MRSRAYSTFFLLIFFLPILSLPGEVFADTILISPPSGTYAQGQTFSIRVMVTSQSQAVNAVSATLSYPADKLQVASISKIGSILSLWVEEPSYSNTVGTVSLEGVVPNPGFKGVNGLVVTVNFRVIKTGSASLGFSSGSLLANDGQGTNILRNRGVASYTLTAAPASVQVTPSESELTVEPSSYFYSNQQNIKSPQKPAQKVITFQIPEWKDIYNWLTKFLSVVITLLALVYLLMHTAKRGVSNLRSLRKDIHGIDHLVGKSFSLIKEGVNDSIHILERAKTKRKLTQEEDAIIRHLRQNLVDAEKAIHTEIERAEKDIGG